jgi:hypothetical protein
MFWDWVLVVASFFFEGSRCFCVNIDQEVPQDYVMQTVSYLRKERKSKSV